MFDIVFDVESTGINPYTDEIIEAFFIMYEGENVKDTFHLKCRVDNWSYEAEEIHGITYQKMMTYKPKDKAYRELLTWLPNGFRFITYANKNTQLGRINYDYAILINELNLLGMDIYYLKNNYNMADPISAHTMARKILSGRIKKFRQSDVYTHLFNDSYDGHNAKNDSYALARIYFKLIELENENNSEFRLC